MIEFKHIVKAKAGLHARPSGRITSLARNYKSDVTVYSGNSTADGRRLLSVMALGAKCGSELRFEISGEDEEQAAQALKELCEECI